MKMTPRISFFLDTTPRYVQHIDELIKTVHENDGDSYKGVEGATYENEIKDK